MKKIKIITVYGSYNHGSYLQAKCLFDVLSAYGDVSFIDKKAREWNYFKTPFMRIKHNLRVNFKHPLRNIKTVAFEYTEAAKSKRNWKKLPSSEDTGCDVCVLGSDEIWNVKRSDCRLPVFFGDGVSAKKISYAPSVNTATEEDFRQYPEFAEDRRRMDEFGVRDSKTLETVQAVTGRTAELVLDPTLLRDVPKTGYSRKKKYIAVYTFDTHIGPEDRVKLREFAREKGCELVGAGQNILWCDRAVHAKDGNPFVAYEGAELIVTSTFHGTAYAVNHRKNFVVLTNHNDKVEELLRLFHLEDRMIHSADDIRKVANKDIDYTQVNETLRQMRERSFGYLESALETNKDCE